MSIGKRIKFIAKSYLNDLLDGDLTDDLKKGVKGIFDGGTAAEDEYADIDLDELERKFNEEFADLNRATQSAEARSRQAGGSRRSRKSQMAKHYAALGLKPGAPFNEVRSQFRKLMRKYHPDRFADDPRKQAQMTKKSQAISEAFAAIEKAEQKG
jgi:DnaJ-domain-containing protein 1